MRPHFTALESKGLTASYPELCLATLPYHQGGFLSLLNRMSSRMTIIKISSWFMKREASPKLVFVRSGEFTNITNVMCLPTIMAIDGQLGRPTWTCLIQVGFHGTCKCFTAGPLHALAPQTFTFTAKSTRCFCRATILLLPLFRFTPLVAFSILTRETHRWTVDTIRPFEKTCSNRFATLHRKVRTSRACRIVLMLRVVYDQCNIWIGSGLCRQ